MRLPRLAHAFLGYYRSRNPGHGGTCWSDRYRLGAVSSNVLISAGSTDWWTPRCFVGIELDVALLLCFYAECVDMATSPVGLLPMARWIDRTVEFDQRPLQALIQPHNIGQVTSPNSATLHLEVPMSSADDHLCSARWLWWLLLSPRLICMALAGRRVEARDWLPRNARLLGWSQV